MTSARSRILYFVPERPALADGVLHAQVLVPARYLRERGLECMFVGAEVSEERAVEAQETIQRNYGVPAHVYAAYSKRVPYFSSVWTAFQIRRRSKPCVHEFRPTHVYTRGYNAAVAARRVARDHGATLVFDVRGAAAAETAMKRGEGPAYWFLLNRELTEIRKADRLSCVSHRLKNWICDQTGRTDVAVIPCCVDLSQFAFRPQARSEIRGRYGLSSSDKLLCYCGDLGRWQRIESIIALFGKVAQVRRDFRFLFLSRQQEAVTEWIRRAGLPLDRCIVVGCAHSEVASYLSAADAGVIMREDILVNNVASPVKVAEYLGCGLPVILTPGIGDYSDVVTQAGVGLLLDEAGDTAGQVTKFMDACDGAAIRERTVAFARNNLTWESHLKTLLDIFDGAPHEAC